MEDASYERGLGKNKWEPLGFARLLAAHKLQRFPLMKRNLS